MEWESESSQCLVHIDGCGELSVDKSWVEVG